MDWSDSRNDSGYIPAFENTIPVEPPTKAGSPEHGEQRGIDGSPECTAPSVHRKSPIKSLLWPVLVITVPIALLSTALLALVLGYHVKSQPSLFDAGIQSGDDTGYILVNYPATRLVFAASFLSTVAPILGSFIMMLWHLRTSQSMRTAAVEGQSGLLPTPYQLSLIIGITLASAERLRRYFRYLCSYERPTIPPVLHHAATMFTFSIILAVAVFFADVALHYTTSTISFDAITHDTQPTYEYGRGLSHYCLNFNRTENEGFPCSYNITVDDPEIRAQLNEIFYLQHNTSTTSEIQLIQNNQFSHGDLAVLMPQMAGVPLGIDYRTSTVGVATQCFPITTTCDMQAPDALVPNAPNWDYTYFNCSEGFYGILGKSPNISELTAASQDPSVPPLGFKPAPNLQYGFFTDAKLISPYNPEEYNASTEQPALQSYTASRLISPIYLGLAARFGASQLAIGSHLNDESEIFNVGNEYSDFILSCAFTAYDVSYTLASGLVRDLSFSPSPNGTMLEMFHARQFYISVTGGDSDLQDYILQAAMQGSSEELAHKWANLYSTKVLSTIGGYTSSRSNVQEQHRTQLLVAKVPKAALAALIAFSLAYTVLGITLGIAAYRASAGEVHDLAAQLSLAGLTTAAFDERKTYTSDSAGTSPSSSVFTEKLTRQETRRVLIDGSPERGYEFRVMV